MDLKGFAKKIHDFIENYDDLVEGVLKEVGQFATQHYKELGEQAGLVATGRYVKGWRYVASPDELRIWNKQDYSGVLEHGRPAGFKPPVKGILKWAAAKLGVDPNHPGARRMASNIAMAIARRGLPAHRIAERGQEEVERRLAEGLSEMIQRELG